MNIVANKCVFNAGGRFPVMVYPQSLNDQRRTCYEILSSRLPFESSSADPMNRSY